MDQEVIVFWSVRISRNKQKWCHDVTHWKDVMVASQVWDFVQAFNYKKSKYVFFVILKMKLFRLRKGQNELDLKLRFRNDYH